jgi:Tfp pilus assembly protein PilN
MIKINLCPIDELQNPYWAVPDAVVFTLIAIVSYFSVDLYFSAVQDQMNETQVKIESLSASTAQLEPDLARFKTLDQDVKALQTKLIALQRITVSKMEKFTPIIVLEHLQNLKPQGVWYTALTLKNGAIFEFSLKGMAFDNLMTAELLTSLRATASTDVDPSDLRSQVFFDGLSLIEAAISGTRPISPDPNELVSYPSTFDIRGTIKERSAKPTLPSNFGSPPLGNTQSPLIPPPSAPPPNPTSS